VSSYPKSKTERASHSGKRHAPNEDRGCVISRLVGPVVFLKSDGGIRYASSSLKSFTCLKSNWTLADLREVTPAVSHCGPQAVLPEDRVLYICSSYAMYKAEGSFVPAATDTGNCVLSQSTVGASCLSRVSVWWRWSSSSNRVRFGSLRSGPTLPTNTNKYTFVKIHFIDIISHLRCSEVTALQEISPFKIRNAFLISPIDLRVQCIITFPTLV
jgi:hypothetical protein